jgi:hypothetical protein
VAAAWKRLLLLCEAVADQGAVLQEQQLNKEREQAADMLARMDQGQVRHHAYARCLWKLSWRQDRWRGEG